MRAEAGRARSKPPTNEDEEGAGPVEAVARLHDNVPAECRDERPHASVSQPRIPFESSPTRLSASCCRPTRSRRISQRRPERIRFDQVVDDGETLAWLLRIRWNVDIRLQVKGMTTESEPIVLDPALDFVRLLWNMEHGLQRRSK